jgi:hypothetical protein
MRVGDHHSALNEPGFFEPGCACHLTIAVGRKPAAENRVIVLLSARPDGRNTSPDGVTFDQCRLPNLDAGDIGDRIPRSRRSFKRDAKIASPFRLSGQ